MDANRFDRIVKGLSAAGTRRGVLHLLATLPILGALTARFSEEAADAKRKRKAKRRVGSENHKHKGQRRKHKNHQEKNRKHACKPKSAAQTCADRCGSVKNNCKKTVDCGPCVCDPPCAGVPELCCGGACTDTNTDPDNCGACGQTCSGDTPVCWIGGCVCGDVCESGCQFTAVQAAINEANDGATITICAGTYLGSDGVAAIDKDLTIIGAGDGADSATNTILDGDGGSAVPLGVLSIANGRVVSLRGLRITGGAESGVYNAGTLTMADCTATGNSSSATGGVHSDGPLTLTDCTVSENTGPPSNTGGVRIADAFSLTRCTISENTGGVGGLWVQGTGTLTETTITDNTRTNPFAAGGLYTDLGTTTLIDSTISGNTPPNCLATIMGTINGPGCAP